MMRSWAYNCCGVLMGTSWRASCPRWLSLRGDSLPMITLLPSQGDFCATAKKRIEVVDLLILEDTDRRPKWTKAACSGPSSTLVRNTILSARMAEDRHG